MKRLGVVFLMTISLTFSTQTYSYYNHRNNMPVVEMMLTMMEIMSRMIQGGRNFRYYQYPFSPLPLNGLLMSPAYPYASSNGFSPWANLNHFNAWNQNPFLKHDSEHQDNSVDDGRGGINDKQSFFGTNLDQAWETMQNNVPSFSVASMNGIWQAISGDVIAIYNDRQFIWTDGNRRHLAGSVVIKGNQMVAYIPANNRYLSFQFYREDDKFAVRDLRGQIYLFKKIH